MTSDSKLLNGSLQRLIGQLEESVKIQKEVSKQLRESLNHQKTMIVNHVERISVLETSYKWLQKIGWIIMVSIGGLVLKEAFAFLNTI